MNVERAKHYCTFVKTTHTHTQILLTNVFAPLLHHLPLIDLLIKQNKITLNPLVSTHRTPTALLLQSSAVPSGLPGSQEYRKVLTAYTLPFCLSLSDFLCFSFIHICIFALYLFCFFFCKGQGQWTSENHSIT